MRLERFAYTNENDTAGLARVQHPLWNPLRDKRKCRTVMKLYIYISNKLPLKYIRHYVHENYRLEVGEILFEILIFLSFHGSLMESLAFNVA